MVDSLPNGMNDENEESCCKKNKKEMQVADAMPTQALVPTATPDTR
jgi:hypothetical protein